jgi:hypothetical protein
MQMSAPSTDALRDVREARRTARNQGAQAVIAAGDLRFAWLRSR